jgi:hypothetical protein
VVGKIQRRAANKLAIGKRTKTLKSYFSFNVRIGMFLHVTGVSHIKDYELRLEFSDGVVKDVDLSGELHAEVFEPLQDLACFNQVKVNLETNTIEWPNEADFAPEFLYEIGEEVKRVA